MSVLYQSVLMMHDADLKPGKVAREQHKYWRYVTPIRTYFDWLPARIAQTFCSTALELFPERLYGEIHHLGTTDDPRFACMTFQNIYNIGDTKSVQELEVFLEPQERLRLGCGLQCTEAMLPLGPNHRPKLYTAAVKLLRFAIGINHVRPSNEAEEALRAAVSPLLQLPDEHVLATICAVVLALRVFEKGELVSPLAECLVLAKRVQRLCSLQAS